MPVKSAPQKRPNRMKAVRVLPEAVDQHADADVDAGAHAIGVPNFAIHTNM